MNSFTSGHNDHLDPDRNIPDDYPDDDEIVTAPVEETLADLLHTPDHNKGPVKRIPYENKPRYYVANSDEPSEVSEEPDIPCDRCMCYADKIVVLDADDIVCTRTDIDEIQGKFFNNHPDVCKALHVTGQENCVHIYDLKDFVYGFNEDTINTTNSFIVHIKMRV